jgi:hypothetical protein
MDVALDVCLRRTIVQRDALIQQSLTTGSQACPARIGGARADAQIPVSNLPPFAENGNISARAHHNENGLMAVTRWRTIRRSFSTMSPSQSRTLGRIFGMHVAESKHLTRQGPREGESS